MKYLLISAVFFATLSNQAMSTTTKGMGLDEVKTFDDYGGKMQFFRFQSPQYREYVNGSQQTVDPQFIKIRSQEMTDDFMGSIHHELGRTSNQEFPNVGAINMSVRFWAPGFGEGVQSISPCCYFVSGGRTLSSQEFKKAKRLKTANPDYINAECAKQIQKLKNSSDDSNVAQQGIVLGKALENEIRAKLIGGGWRENATHTEALMLLELRKCFPRIMQNIYNTVKSFYQNKNPDAKPTKISIKSMVLEIPQYYKSCFKCIGLVQGFQHKSSRLFMDCADYLRTNNLITDCFEIHDYYGTLAISYGKKTPQKGYELPNVKKGEETPLIRQGQHQYIDAMGV